VPLRSVPSIGAHHRGSVAGRRNLSAYDRSRLALRLEAEIAGRAKAKQVETLKKGDSPVKQISAEREAIETRKEVAKIAGVSHDTIAKVKRQRWTRKTPARISPSGGESAISMNPAANCHGGRVFYAAAWAFRAFASSAWASTSKGSNAVNCARLFNMWHAVACTGVSK